MSVAPYDHALVEAVASALTLREPNRQALDALARAIDSAAPGAELVADLATGVGKTYVAGALLEYLHESGVRNVLIVTPGSTIQRKTIDNLTPGHPKFLRGLTCRPTLITIDDVERGSLAQELDDPDRFKVFVLTVQSLLSPHARANRRAWTERETLGQSLVAYLRAADDLVVIADEHHVYFSGKARQFQAAVSGLDAAVLVGLTATPHPSTPPERIVYRYPLAEAIADGFVKIPVLVARADGLKDTRAQLADGVALLDAKRAAVAAYCARTGIRPIEPVMLVVASTIDEATELRDLLAGPDLLDDRRAVLLVTSEEPDDTVRLLDRIEEPGSPIRAVVSVSMLKEGWDCTSIYVIASVRSMESQLLTEQILGRGLRLPFGRRTGIGMLDSVEVLSHHKFAELLADAEVLLARTPGERAGEASISGSTDAAGRLRLLTLRRGDDGGGDGDALEDAGEGRPVGGIATVEARLVDAGTATTVLTANYPARAVGGVHLPLLLPQVSTRTVRPPFSLTMIDLVDVEALGARFAGDNAPALRRTALDVSRHGAGVQVAVEDRTAEASDPSFQPRIPFDAIEPDLVARLLSTDDVAATTTEATAAAAVAAAFLRGAGVTERTPWHAQQARLATEALVGALRRRRAQAPVSTSVTVTLATYPEPAETTVLTSPVPRHRVSTDRQFSRGQPYSGWQRSLFPVAAFDAYSTDFRLAECLDSDDDVTAWLRVTPGVPLAISYDQGSRSRSYRPDFLVIDSAGRHWVVEGTADTALSDPSVLARRDAAARWVSAVNAADNVRSPWGYLLVSESVITIAAGRWSALAAAGFAVPGQPSR
ncbi:MAG TPA: DEAD/DEAH box helicase family protein [Kineosporiaceae bacterium]